MLVTVRLETLKPEIVDVAASACVAPAKPAATVATNRLYEHRLSLDTIIMDKVTVERRNPTNTKITFCNRNVFLFFKNHNIVISVISLFIMK